MWLKGRTDIVVIDDEADYATPNSGVNKGTKTAINRWVSKLIGADGRYVGVTATPARLDLNNTFGNDTGMWVKFPPHSKYTGQDTFFPIDSNTIEYRLSKFTPGANNSKAAQDALIRFLVTSAYLNLNGQPGNYTMLVHTSGKRTDHEADRLAIEKTAAALRDAASDRFDELAKSVFETAASLYPDSNAQQITEFVVENASRVTLIVLNSKRDRKAALAATEPTSPFTIVIGGNIVSRGVTFPNLVSMFFTRNVRSKLQQDTYIQRARMFGARGKYLKHFELTIPTLLYDDWRKCFVFHKLSLATIENNLGVPVWIGDSRISVASRSSIDRATVNFDTGEMSFGKFAVTPRVSELVKAAPTELKTLRLLQKEMGKEALPTFLIEWIENSQMRFPDSLAIHEPSSIAGYKTTADQKEITRKKGFIGNPQLESARFPDALHHVKIFHNAQGTARVFYKFTQRVSFTQNSKRLSA